MLKEIHEQPRAVAETVVDRLAHGYAELGDIGIDDDELRGLRRVVIVACGTSYHAGVIGRYAIETWSRRAGGDGRGLGVPLPRPGDRRARPGDRHHPVRRDPDTLAAMRLAREKGAKVMAVTNIMGSQATRDADGVLYTRAGLEIGVAATKTFVSQVAAMYLFALKLAQVHDTLEPDDHAELVRELHDLSHKVEALLGSVDEPVRAQAEHGRTRASSCTWAATRAGRGARGRAQDQGDLLHAHRRVRGG